MSTEGYKEAGSVMPDFLERHAPLKKGKARHFIAIDIVHARHDPSRNDTLLPRAVTSFFYFEFYDTILRSSSQPLAILRPVACVASTLLLPSLFFISHYIAGTYLEKGRGTEARKCVLRVYVYSEGSMIFANKLHSLFNLTLCNFGVKQR